MKFFGDSFGCTDNSIASYQVCNTVQSMRDADLFLRFVCRCLCVGIAEREAAEHENDSSVRAHRSRVVRAIRCADVTRRTKSIVKYFSSFSFFLTRNDFCRMAEFANFNDMNIGVVDANLLKVLRLDNSIR